MENNNKNNKQSQTGQPENSDTSFFEWLELEERKNAEKILRNANAIENEKLYTRKLETEIEKLNIEILRDKVLMHGDKLRNTKEQVQLEMETRKTENIKSKLYFLREVLTDNILDKERTILGSEPLFKPLLEDENREIAMNKLMNLIDEL